MDTWLHLNTVLFSAGNKKKDIFQSNLSHSQCLTAGCNMRQRWNLLKNWYVRSKSQEYLIPEIKAMFACKYSLKKRNLTFHWRSLHYKGIYVSLTARREQKKINAYQITPHEFVQAAAANKYALAPAGAKVQTQHATLLPLAVKQISWRLTNLREQARNTHIW